MMVTVHSSAILFVHLSVIMLGCVKICSPDDSIFCIPNIVMKFQWVILGGFVK